MAVFFKTLILPPWHLSLIVSPKTAILGSQKVDLPPFRNHIWRIGQLASSSLRGGVGLLISGLQHAKFTLWASFNLPSSQARVTSVNSLSKLEKYYFTVTSVLMHALILVIWGHTTTANWREPYQCYQCDYNFFCKPTVMICCYEITPSAFQVILELSWLKKSNVTFFGFHNVHLHSVSWFIVLFQIFSTF